VWSTGSVTMMQGMFDGATAFDIKYTAKWDTYSIKAAAAAFTQTQPCPDVGYNKQSHKPYGTAIERCGGCIVKFEADGGLCVATVVFKPSSRAVLKEAVDEWCGSNPPVSAIALETDISAWDTAAVTAMNLLFHGKDSCNPDIKHWNTAAVTNFASMFDGATAFNQPIGGWDTSGVTNMALMFNQASEFNQAIDDWDTAKVTSMNDMFRGASKFQWQHTATWNTQEIEQYHSLETQPCPLLGYTITGPNPEIPLEWGRFKGTAWHRCGPCVEDYQKMNGRCEKLNSCSDTAMAKTVSSEILDGSESLFGIGFGNIDPSGEDLEVTVIHTTGCKCSRSYACKLKAE